MKKQKQIPFSYKPKLDRHALPVILWNLLPVTGVLLGGWKPENVFICYALETIVVGIFSVFKLLTVHYYGLKPEKEEGASDLISITFFIIVYFGGALLVLQVFFFDDDAGLFHALYGLLNQRAYNIALGAFVLNCFYSFINDFMLTGEYTKRSMSQQMFEPFPRIFVQQVVVILGGGLFFLTRNGYPVLIVFVGLKIYLDLMLRVFLQGSIYSDNDPNKKLNY